MSRIDLDRTRKRWDALIALALARAGSTVPVFVQRRPLPFTALYVDPQDSTGHASNANPGTSPLAPILNTAEVNRRFFFGLLIGNTSLNYLSEETGTVGFDMSTIDLGTFNLTINMTPIVTHTGGTINAGTTAINPAAAAGGQRQTIHTTDLGTFAPFVFTGLGGASAIPQRLIDTVTGASAWIASGVATASVTRPVDEAVASSPAMTIGDAYRIQRPGLLPLANAPAPVSDGGLVSFHNCAFPASSVGPAQLTGFSVQPVTCNHCAFLGPLLFGGLFADSYFASGFQGNWVGSVVAGLLIPNVVTDQQTGAINFSGDTYITGQALIIGGTFYQALFVASGGLGVPGTTGVQVQDVTPAGTVPAVQVIEGGTGFVEGLVWGNGNSGVGVSLLPGANFTPEVVPSVTGTGGDFGFGAAGVSRTTARAWDETGGVYTAPIACTWANFSTAIGGGGFGQNAHDLTGNSSLVSF